MIKLQQFIKNFDPRFILLSVVIVILSIVSGFLIRHFELGDFQKQSVVLAQISGNQKATLTQLNQMQANLNHLSVAIKNNDLNKEDLTILSKQLTAIEASILHLNPQTSNETLKTLIADENTKLVNQFLKKQKRAQKHKNSRNTFSLSKLPFNVASIDIWNGQSMATISMGSETTLMGEGDSRSGWTLLAINFDESSAIFKNKYNQLIKLSI